MLYNHNIFISCIDPSLNVENIQEVMKGEFSIPDLDVPNKTIYTARLRLNEEKLSDNERISEYVYSHPCPSWSHIMRQLQDMGLTGAAKRASKFIKGYNFTCMVVLT